MRSHASLLKVLQGSGILAHNSNQKHKMVVGALGGSCKERQGMVLTAKIHELTNQIRHAKQ